jgi:magnesium transporter
MSLKQNSLSRKNSLLELNQAIYAGSLYQVKQMIKTLPTAGIAHLIESSPPNSRSVLWQLIDKELEGEVIQSLREDLQNDILRELNAAQVVELTEGLETDDLADILQQLPQQIAAEVLQDMDQQNRQRLESVLSYDEDTAGGLMNTDTITVRRNHTVELVLRYLRRHETLPEMTDNILVVNRDDELLGILPLQTILVSNPNTSVHEVMREDIEAIPVEMAAAQVTQLFEQHDWVSAPVVDDNNKLLGRITIDDVVDVIRDTTEHTLMSMAGLDEEDDTFAPIIKTARRRALWLGVNSMMAILASLVIYLFQETLDQVVYLAVLMPIIANMGGVAGTQTLTLIVRGIALGHINASNSRWLLFRELGVASINGLIWASFISIIAFLWYQDLQLSYIVAGAMLINLTTGGLAGAYLPLFLRKISVDPALAGSVLLTTITDSIGFFAFLGLAQVFYL